MLETIPPDGLRPVQVRRTGSFDLDCDPDAAFPFFSPEGEREWVAGWSPKPVFPDQIAFERDTVFQEGGDTQPAIWTVVEVDWQTHRAEYVRLAPRSHSAHITVKIEPAGLSLSQVVVKYVITAFGEEQAALLDAFSEANYAAKMRAWRQSITNCLKKRESRRVGSWRTLASESHTG